MYAASTKADDDASAVQNHPNMRILIAGTENITSMLYFGNVKSMLITNCLCALLPCLLGLSSPAQQMSFADFLQMNLIW